MQRRIDYTPAPNIEEPCFDLGADFRVRELARPRANGQWVPGGACATLGEPILLPASPG